MNDGLDHSPFGIWEVHQLGNEVQIKGVIVGDNDTEYQMYLPNESYPPSAAYQEKELTPTEWQTWLKAADDPKYLDEVTKAVVRKVTRHVDQEMMWATYRRDNFTCQYCGATDRALTYDHWVAQKYGGPTTVENGVTACRPCNKAKGHMTVDQWETYMKDHNFHGPKSPTP